MSDEIACVQAYGALQQIRYGDNFQIEWPTGDTSGWRIPPLTLQMLVENAIKHNEISRKRPLRVRIVLSEGQIQVHNDHQPRLNPAPSTGKGLANIRARYALLSNQEIEVQAKEETFTVSLPLLALQTQAAAVL